MLGSKYTPRSAMSFSASSLTKAPCSTWVQPAFTARIAASALWAWTIERNPCGVAGALVRRADRGENARARQHAAINGLPQIPVAHGAGALHGGEAVDQRD